jgi:hypothetical protein
MGCSTKLALMAGYSERWSAHRDVQLSAWTDEELDAVMLPLV